MASPSPQDETMPLTGGEDLHRIGDEEVRRGFVSKVYSILAVQLVATTLLAGAVMAVAEDLIKQHPGLLLVGLFMALALSLGISCVWFCAPQTMRAYPTNYILLSLFTLAQSVIVGFVCAGYTQESVLIALAITTVVVCFLSVFASCTSIDFTGAGPYLICALLVLTGFGLCLVFASAAALGSSPGEYAAMSPAFSTARLVFAALGALLFSAFLVYDTQLILGGKHGRLSFSVDDYAMAAIAIYVDIIEIFLNFLHLTGDRD